MSYNIIAVPKFRKDLKTLAKKYPSLKEDFALLLDNLKANPIQGTAIGKNCYKIRVAIKSKGKGKSGGARVITNIVIDKITVYLLVIYDKNEKDTLTNKEIEELLKNLED